MSEDPAPRGGSEPFASALPIAASAVTPPPIRVGFEECWRYCLAESERHAAWRDHFKAAGHGMEAARRDREAVIFQTLMKLLDRNRDPVILARLKELSAIEASDAKIATGEETNDAE